MRKIKIYSEQFGYMYEAEETIPIVNTKQAGLYIKHNIKLIDIYWSNGVLCYVFNRKDTREAYDLWLKHELA